jgi:hypothetical protein
MVISGSDAKIILPDALDLEKLEQYGVDDYGVGVSSG